MVIRPPTYSIPSHKCFFCDGLLDFLVSESLKSGLSYTCIRCEMLYTITDFSYKENKKEYIKS